MPSPGLSLVTLDANRMVADVQYQLSLGPRTPGSPGHEKIVQWLKDELVKAGWGVGVQGTSVEGHTTLNVIGKRGNGNSPWIILGAHYDTRLWADRDVDASKQHDPVPGAEDGASGVAVLMELARTLPSDLKAQIWLVFIDTEDQGNIPGWNWLLGSTAMAEYVSAQPKPPDAVVILDMVGDANLNIPIEQNSNPKIVSEIWDIAGSLGYGNYFQSRPGYSMLDDHTPFLERGIPAVDIIDFDYPYWHTTQDTADKVSPASLRAVGETMYTWLTNKAPAPATTFAQLSVPDPGAPDVADYQIATRLDPANHQLVGRETITYRNTTQKPIPDLVFHLYLNAFKNKDTVFMRESGGQLRGDKFDPQYNGWIEVDSLQLKDGSALKLELLEDGTLARAELPSPVKPGETVQVELAFRAQLPKVFARTGWALDNAGQPFFLVGQWFPKLGVWTEQGWNANVFHGNAEFFADFGSYNVSITLPGGYVTGAVGLPQSSVKNSDGSQTVTYQAAGVIDFAWVASPSLRSASRKVGDVEIVYLYLPEHEWSVDRELAATSSAITHFGEWFGPYPYSRLSVVDVPDQGAGAGGMEYPTFVTVGADNLGGSVPPGDGWTDYFLVITVHEVAHQWWQSMVATDEADEPWLDEGFADTSTMLLLSADYGLDRKALVEPNTSSYAYLVSQRSDYLLSPGLPMDEKAWDYTVNDYWIAAYAKPDMAMLTLEGEVGQPMFMSILHTYFQRYRFAHPTTADFREVAVQVSAGINLDWFFDGLVYHGKTVNFKVKAIQEDSFTVEREGDLVVPVDILVNLMDGTQQMVTWDGKEREKTFTFQHRLKSIHIDPDGKLLIELDWSDNEVTSP